MLLTRANWKKCRKCQDIPLCVVEICLVLTIIILLTQVLLDVINYTFGMNCYEVTIINKITKTTRIVNEIFFTLLPVFTIMMIDDHHS